MIGFTDDKNGWLIGLDFHGLGNQNNYIFLTNDSGQTWTETNNVNNEYPKVLICGGFADSQIGFLCFRFTDYSDLFPVFRTNNAVKLGANRKSRKFHLKTVLTTI
jgi:hypothetical protein